MNHDSLEKSLVTLPVFIASDHRGFELKNRLLEIFPNFIETEPKDYNPDDDYNDAAVSVAKAILSRQQAFGILICGSAIGVSIQANRFKHIRAAICLNPETASLARLHNDANILCLSADIVKTDADFENVRQTVATFLTTDFSNESRHLRRIGRLDEEI